MSSAVPSQQITLVKSLFDAIDAVNNLALDQEEAEAKALKAFDGLLQAFDLLQKALVSCSVNSSLKTNGLEQSTTRVNNF